jgi:ABC-2 type transport system permease protein
MNWRRVEGVVLEHWFHLFHSIEDLTDTFFWPSMDLIIWGFMTTYFINLSGAIPGVVNFLLGGLILWNIVWRSQQDVSVTLLKDVWNRNVINLFSTPLTPWEYLVGSVLLGFIKIFLTLTVVVSIAWFLWSFSIFTLGFALIPFFINLIIFGWSMGIIITGLIIRFGMRIQSVAWSLILIFNPLSAVFYPLETLPPVLQKISWYIPTAHVFEGMRQVLSGGEFPMMHLLWAGVLNVIYLVAACLIFFFFFEKAREHGSLASLTEG